MIRSGPEAHSVDPHVWFDISLWSAALAYASEELQAWQPTWKPALQQNTSAYLQQLAALDQRTRTQVAELVRKKQVLVTANTPAGTYLGMFEANLTLIYTQLLP